MGGVACFLPCRAGSERVPRKNIMPFGPFAFGLVELKLAQLLAVPQIDMVYLSTDDREVQDYAASLDTPKLHIHNRAEDLCLGSTPISALVQHAHDLAKDHDHILWTHVTSPFTTRQIYTKIINAYFESFENGFDSLMTTTPIHAYLWDDNGPLNYHKGAVSWPRTQDLAGVHEVNSAALMAPLKVYEQIKDRVGLKPFLFEMGKLTGHDIDWPEDFKLAELMLESGLVAT